MRIRSLVLGLTAVGVLAPAAVAGAAPATQSIDIVLGGKATPKLDKKKFAGTSVQVTTATSDVANPAGLPPKATNAKINFDRKDMRFDPTAAPKCDQVQIANTPTDVARTACKSSLVGTGSGIASLPFGVGGARQDFPAVVSAFNRADEKGILLHSRVDQLGTTVVLLGKLTGSTLDVLIPPLGGGVGAIAEFQVKVKKGKYVQGRCSDKSIKTSSTFTFTDAPPAPASDVQKCKQG